jgi:dTDP-4-amino-4,6-dideoxygalactose transaminase
MTEGRWHVPLSDVATDDELVRAAADTVKSGWWSMGPRVAEFEEAFAKLCGSSHALAVANGTAALHLALLAVECGPGDEVLVPSLNFVAAANTIVHTGATPVFVDISGEDDLNMDPADVEAAITPATKAMVVLHYGGYSSDMGALMRIAEKHDLVIIEDAAHAPGGSYDGRKCGTFGAIGCFSFFSNKNLPVGEGGMIVTDDDDLAERLRLLRSHGMTTLTWDRHRGHAHSYDVVTHGFNYRLDEIRAALGLVQLRRLPKENAQRAEVSTRYREALHGTAGIAMPFPDSEAQRLSSHHLAVVVLPEGVDRVAVRTALQELRIQTSVHYPPIHQFSAYDELGSRRSLPRTDAVADRVLTLPLYAGLSDEQIETVVRELVAAVEAASESSS